MSQKIRIGNDIRIRWSLMDAEQQPYILTNRDVSVELNVGTKKVRIKELEVEENTIIFTYYGMSQRYTGNYILKFIENDGEKEMVTFDINDAFTLVAHSWQAIDEGETPGTIQLEFVTINSTLVEQIGPKGDPGPGVPRGGESGSVLAKASGADYDTEWTDPEDIAPIRQVKVNGIPMPMEDKTVDIPVPIKLRELSEDATHRTVTDTEKQVWGDKVSQAQITDFITHSVNDLLNYYRKNETYTRAEIRALLDTIKQFTYESVAVLPTASADTMHKIYLVPSTDPQSQNVKDEYITIYNGDSAPERYTWEKIGSTDISFDLISNADINDLFS